MAQEKIYQFDKELLNMIMKPHYVGVDENGKKMTYRLVKGESELNKKFQDEDAEVIRFRVNTHQMKVDDETTQIWLENNPLFKSGKIRIYDPKAASKKQMATIQDNLQTLLKVTQLKNEDLLGLGYQIFGKDAFHLVKEKGYEGLRADLVTYANVASEDVENKLSEKNAHFTWAALAFAKGIIVEGDAGNSVRWGHSDAVIITVTKGKKPIEQMVEYFKTREGAEVKQEIGLHIQRQATDQIVDDAEVVEDEAPVKTTNTRRPNTAKK